jgi:hypothetical protein
VAAKASPNEKNKCDNTIRVLVEDLKQVVEPEDEIMRINANGCQEGNQVTTRAKNTIISADDAGNVFMLSEVDQGLVQQATRELDERIRQVLPNFAIQMGCNFRERNEAVDAKFDEMIRDINQHQKDIVPVSWIMRDCCALSKWI